MKKNTEILYICSAGHSGSTLLDLMVGGHPEIMSLGEIVHLPKNLALNTQCTCGAPVRECELWKKVIHVMEKKSGYDYSKDPYRLNLGYIKSVTIRDEEHQTRGYDIKWKTLSGLYLANHLYGLKFIPSFLYKELTESAKTSISLYDEIGGLTNTPIVVDSSKSYMRGLSLFEQAPERVRILLLTRDARGVQYSNIKRGRSGAEALMSWTKHYSRASKTLLKTVGKENWLHVKYEDLATDPKNVLKKICDFSNVEFSEEMLNLAGGERHLTNGNSMRFSNVDEIRLDVAWKEKLTKEDLDDYKKIAEKLNRSFGYV